MNLVKLFVLFLLPISQITLATTVFADDASVQNGTEPPVSYEEKVDPGHTLLICSGFNAGQLDSVRKDGIRLYGSVENFYSQMYQMQCPPNAPSPIYSGINVRATADGYPQMFRDLAKLAPEVRSRLLNRPTSGRRTETILDLIDRRMKLAAGLDDVTELYQNKRARFIELGAKKVSEMTADELAVYE
ncbi:hypothetical protein [Methylophaga sp.]|uniref:hypothetical protein n=1 Tax=Methylophaga sp. TaxID=2024840 RepID=UPI0027174DFE|nr:hypothetical protein [Methylophaga sp.]MDO8826961.1 hypothetical protein [Methylophaga sp.]